MVTKNIYRNDPVLDLSSFRSSNPVYAPVGASRIDRPHWDTLDKSLVVFRLPTNDDSSTPRLHRRVDLICSPIETYWTAIVGWYAFCTTSYSVAQFVMSHFRTGSTLFERDLRLWAKQKM